MADRYVRRDGLHRASARHGLAGVMNPTDWAKIEDGYAGDYTGRFEQGEHVPDETQNTDAEGVDWGEMANEASVSTGEPMAYTPNFPENGPLPEARISINFRVTGEPQVTVRGHTAQEITEVFNEMEAAGIYANIAAAMASLRVQGQLGAGLGPVTPVGPPQAPSGPPAPPQGQYAAPMQQSPGAPPFGPNVSAPNAPGYQGPPPPQGGGWGGQQQRGGGAQEKPRPAGWLVADIPYNDKDRFKNLRAQGTETGNYLRGKIQWGGRGTYWIEPSVAGWLAQQGFPVTQ